MMMSIKIVFLLLISSKILNIYKYQYNININLTKVYVNDIDTFRYEKADPWPDKLSGIKDGIDEIVYDENGNPISLDDTTISWTNGRQLASFNTVDENGNKTPFLSFTYDDSGIRTSKTFGDTTTYYTNIDGNVTSQYQLDENGNIINLAEFIYDSANEVIGFTYEGETYFYLKNLQNDVLGVIDSNCELIARYDYSTWGFHTGWSNDDINGDIYDVNPFRYRSYIYDEEMSMCYLQSRYYITTFGRFLNSDLPEYAQVQKGITAGLNLFAYCCNDPVNNVDPSGACINKKHKTIKDAVKKFANDYFATSTKLKKELCALVYSYYERHTLYYGYTGYAIGEKTSCNPVQQCKYYKKPNGSKIVATIHTHPNQKEFGGFSYADFEYNRYYKLNGYVVGYKGVYYHKYTKRNGDQTRIFNYLCGVFI